MSLRGICRGETCAFAPVLALPFSVGKHSYYPKAPRMSHHCEGGNLPLFRYGLVEKKKP